MADGAEVTLGWYDNSLTADEARVLRALDHQVVHVLYMNNVHVRPEWSSRTEHQERFIHCIIADPQPRVLLEVSSREFASLSTDALLSRIEASLKSQSLLADMHRPPIGFLVLPLRAYLSCGQFHPLCQEIALVGYAPSRVGALASLCAGVGGRLRSSCGNAAMSVSKIACIETSTVGCPCSYTTGICRYSPTAI
jgi:hypothetical protein